MAKRTLKTTVAKISQTESDWGEAIDAIVFETFTRKVRTSIVSTAAYKLGLVNDRGQTIREPRTAEERRALSFMDRIVFYVKQFAPGRLPDFYQLYYLKRGDPIFMRSLNRAKSLRMQNYYNPTTVTRQDTSEL
jgi:hypothetical protein